MDIEELFDQDFFNERSDDGDGYDQLKEEVFHESDKGVIDITPEEITVIYPWPGLLRKK